MLSKENNDLLTLTGPGTPMGNLMRRYWIPACLSEEVAEPDGAPAQVRLMGEKLIAFRMTDGRVALMGEHCPHRGASLFYGRNEDCAIRCLYHGWKISADGEVLETPAEPDEDAIRLGVRHVAYPTHEAGGIVFAYMGPPAEKPIFPNYAWATCPTSHTYVTKTLQECNYLQGLEGECDSAHLSYLHRALRGPAAERPLFTSRKPSYDYERTDFGVRLVATRITPEDEVYVRLSSFVMPVCCWVPARNKEAHFHVPADDTHSWRYDLGFVDHPVTPKDVGDDRRQYIGPGYVKTQTMANHYLQDRALQKVDSFTGMKGFLAQDSCVTETMGPRFDRSVEYLGLSDKGIVAVRNLLLKTVRDLEKGVEPPHLVRDEAKNAFGHIDTGDALMPAGNTWRDAFPHVLTQNVEAK
jgi:phenylpropionate dioxygenase-like ring-hydroxylating dioxygenase large terminal subunit